MMLAQVGLADDPNEIQMPPVPAGQILQHIDTIMPWYWSIYDIIAPGSKDAFINWQETCSAALGPNAAAQCTVARDQKDARASTALMRLGMLAAALAGGGYLIHRHYKRKGR